MKKISAVSWILGIAIALSGCGGARLQAPTADKEVSVASEAMPVAPMEASGAAPVPMPTMVERPANQGADATSSQRIVIQNADLLIVVSDVKGRMEEIQKMAEEMGGFVVSMNLYQSYSQDSKAHPEGQITIRVPAEKLDTAMDAIKKDTVEVQSETRTGQDVTAEYVDLQSRLKNYEAAEAQLEKILEKATDTEDVVNIFNQLVYYREQIELVKGQMKYYDEAAALSAINIRILAEETIEPVVIGKWEPKGVALKAIQDLVDFLKGFVDFVIRFVIYVLPVLILILLPIYLLFVLVRMVFRKLRGNRPRKQKLEEVEKK